MTIATVMPPAAPATPGSGGGRKGAGSPAAEGFGALMAQHLAGQSVDGEASGREGSAAVTVAEAEQLLAGEPAEGETGAGTAGENAEDETANGDATATGLVALPTLMVVAPATATSTPATGAVTGEAPSQSAGAAIPVSATAATSAAADGTGIVTPLDENAPSEAPASAESEAGEPVPASVTTGSGQGGAGTSNAASTGSAGNPGSPGSAADGSAADAAATAPSGQAVPQGQAVPEGQTASAGQGIAPRSKAGTAAEAAPAEQTAPAPSVTAATASSGAGAASAAPPVSGSGSAVTSQVFPVIPALVTKGEGTQSITLRLHPADLGEVRVTVTVKNGLVDVTLEAGKEAQEALRNGSGELRSLLDLTGAATGQLVVRDLPSGTSAAPATGASSSFNLPDHGADSTPGREAAGDETPGDRASGRARRAGAEADTPLATHPTPSRVAAGLDLTL